MYGEGVGTDLVAGNDQVLLVPGLYNSGPGHWQTLWQKEYGFARVEQQDWDAPRCDDWVETLDRVIRAQSVPVVLVAHSLGCIAVAQWAVTHAESAGRVRAALLVAASDAEREDFPTGVRGFSPIARGPLPFRSIAVASTNDPYTTWARSEEFSQTWGATLVNAGAAGHITTVDGFGPWPSGLAQLELLRQS